MKNDCGPKEVKQKRSIKLPVLQGQPTPKAAIANSRTSRWRAAALIALNLLMIAHIIQWKYMGSTITPIEPSEAMFTLQNGAVNAGFIFFILAITATLIFGRFVCGWGCHIVALQDLCAWMLKKVGLKPKAFRSRLLVYIPLIAALYMFVWPTVLRALTKPAADPLFPQFTNHLITTEFWATFPPVWVAIPFLFVVGFMTVYFLGSKGFCTYGCPYGGFFAVADKVAPGKIRVTDACHECGHCTAVCTSNVKVHAEVKQYGMVVDPGCMKCMDCISVCPNDALYYGFGKPAVGVPKELKPNYSLTWPEEIAGVIIFTASLFAVWNVYQIVPMLMAIGIAIVTTFVALKAWHVLGHPDSMFYHFALRSSGEFQIAGYAFLAFAAFWIGINVHSGWIRYNESTGERAYEALQIPDELALAQANPAQWLSQADRTNIARSKARLRTAIDHGIFTNTYAIPRLAWVEFLSGNTDEAIKLLSQAADVQDGQPKALSLYYRGAILNRLGRHGEAIESLDQAMDVRSDLFAAREEKGEALWQKGRKNEAIVEWNTAIENRVASPLTLNMLAGAAADGGNERAAKELEAEADKITPPDPYFHWVLGLRLQKLGMTRLAEKNFAKAVQIDPAFMLRRTRTPDQRKQ